MEKITGVSGREYFPLPGPEEEARRKAATVLDHAKERFKGEPGRDLDAAACYWAQHIETRHGVHVNLDSQDMCIMMTLLKVAQLGVDPTHREAQVDGCGYFALLEAVQK